MAGGVKLVAGSDLHGTTGEGVHESEIKIS